MCDAFLIYASKFISQSLGHRLLSDTKNVFILQFSLKKGQKMQRNEKTICESSNHLVRRYKMAIRWKKYFKTRSKMFFIFTIFIFRMKLPK